MRSSDLHELASHYSIETSYVDAGGVRRQASRDALVAVIEARAGLAIEKAGSRAIDASPLPPVCVLWGDDRTIDVDLPSRTAVEWSLELEDGSVRQGRCEELGGTITLDRALPAGYHTLRIGDAESLVIAAPMKAHAPVSRSWGAFLPLYAAHSKRSWGVGDFTDLNDYASWIGRFGGSIVATLPMLASFDGEPSPYSPVSRLFWNELYLDVTRLPEYRDEDFDPAALAHLHRSSSIDYGNAWREKRRVLEACARRFIPETEFLSFAETARDYAAFRARREGRDSVDYHLYVQYRASQQVRRAADAAARLGSGLYLDFPLGVHAEGYDAARFSHVFAPNTAVGAPPDLFFTKGQNWGFAPFDPDAVRADRYAYFRRAIRHHLAHAGVLRLDHVMGLHRLYWIPDGFDAKDGVYVNYRAEEFYAILTLESQRSRCVVVGEDLGTVPPEVPRAMERHGLRRMYVVQYEAKPEDPPLPPPPMASIASINTHDMPPFAAYWSSADVDDRLTQDLLDGKGADRERETRESVRRAMVEFLVRQHHLPFGPTRDPAKVLGALLEFLAASEAEMVLVNLEDLWGETVPQNVPGVPGRSWRHRLRVGFEEAAASGSIRRTFERVAALRARDLLSRETGERP